MEKERIYSYGLKRLDNGMIWGFERKGTTLAADGDGYIILPYIDRGEGESRWGRLHIDMELSKNAECSVYIAATGDKQPEEYLFAEDKSLENKIKYMEELGGIRLVNSSDMLLYGLSGRYLWIVIEVKGDGRKVLDNIRVYGRGDFLIYMFPEIYRERNSDFHRYLSIFSTILIEMEEKIKRENEYISWEKAPIHMLPTLAGRMGLDIGGDFLEESVLRKLVKNAYDLNRKRGTREAVERLIEILTGEMPVIVERNRLPVYEDIDRQNIENNMYGKGIYDVTVLICGRGRRYRKSQLLYLINQMIPARCILRIVYLEEQSCLDTYTYLDVNGCIYNGDFLLSLDTGTLLLHS